MFPRAPSQLELLAKFFGNESGGFGRRRYDLLLAFAWRFTRGTPFAWCGPGTYFRMDIH